MDTTLFIAQRTTAQLLPIYPVYLLMFARHGLSVGQISLLLIIWSVPGLLFEVPSSVLADKWNRRNLIAAGRALKSLCFVSWALRGGFQGYAVGFLLWGSGSALCSGTEEAWLYDCLKSYGKEADFGRVWGRGVFCYQAAVGVASVLGALIASVSMRAALWLSVAMMMVSTALAAMLPEHNLYARGACEPVRSGAGWRSAVRRGLREGYETLVEGARFCLSDRVVAAMVAFITLVLITSPVLDEYDQLIVRSIGVPLALIGAWGFARYALEACGGAVAWRLKAASAHRLAALSGAALCMSAVVFRLPILPLYGVYYLLQSSARVIVTDSLQSRVTGQGRATVQSLVNLLESPTGMAMYAVLGGASTFMPFRYALAGVGGFVLIASLLFARGLGRIAPGRGADALPREAALGSSTDECCHTQLELD